MGETVTPVNAIQPSATWKRVLAWMLDFFTVFFVVGMVIAQFTGETTKRWLLAERRISGFAVRHHHRVFRDRSSLCRRHALGSYLSHSTSAAELTYRR
jgi:hypothetical protein